MQSVLKGGIAALLVAVMLIACISLAHRYGMGKNEEQFPLIQQAILTGIVTVFTFIAAPFLLWVGARCIAAGSPVGRYVLIMSGLWLLAGSAALIGFVQETYPTPGVLILTGTVYMCAGALAGWLIKL
ncbi:hypothetical protein [Streptomyces sp. NPDC017529]|uniref:hypothetical protein n=1 Tax=Streptomyces sp. NPDC017529 TaxID=3365000 RepID=UPI003787984A